MHLLAGDFDRHLHRNGPGQPLAGGQVGNQVIDLQAVLPLHQAGAHVDPLAKPQVIHGDFIQEKHLRALPKPLTSTGTFVLARDHGLLWRLKTPLQQDYRITAQGIARRDGTSWQMLPGKSAGAEQNRLFLAVLQGDSSGLQRDFDLQLQGTPDHWTLTLTPRSLLLKQVFKQINIEGGELVQRIELQEAQGDSTQLKMHNSVSNQPLSEAEQHDFAQ